MRLSTKSSVLIALMTLISLYLTGCTITNLAPPQEDDGFLQRELEENFGPYESEATKMYGNKKTL